MGGCALIRNDKNTGFRKKGYWRDSEYHLLPSRQLKHLRNGDSSPSSQYLPKVNRPPYSSIPIELSARAQVRRSRQREDMGGSREQSFPPLWIWVGSLVVLGTGAAAKLACENIPERQGVPRAATHPACTRFTFREGRLGGARCASRIPAGIAGGRGELTASELGADIPVLLCREASDALGGHSGVPRDTWTSRKLRFDMPLKLKCTGYDVLSIISFGRERSRTGQGPILPAAYFEWAFSKTRSNWASGVRRPPYEEDGVYQFGPPRVFRMRSSNVRGRSGSPRA